MAVLRGRRNREGGVRSRSPGPGEPGSCGRLPYSDSEQLGLGGGELPVGEKSLLLQRAPASHPVHQRRVGGWRYEGHGGAGRHPERSHVVLLGSVQGGWRRPAGPRARRHDRRCEAALRSQRSAQSAASTCGDELHPPIGAMPGGRRRSVMSSGSLDGGAGRRVTASRKCRGRSSQSDDRDRSRIDMAVTKVDHPSVADRRARGADARTAVPPSSQRGWEPAADRPDPVAILEAQNINREPDLVPVRHGRMMVSPFTFYRGAARIMATDLARTPTAGLDAQLCGDAHLSNFGGFASPERRLMFDLNDFDETLPGPFEYDVKRMAASFTIAARNNGLTPAEAKDATLASVRSYRAAMAQFAQMGTMELWYTHMSEDDLRVGLDKIASEGAGKKAAKGAAKGKESKSKDGKAKAPKGNVLEEEQTAKAARRAEKNLAKPHTRDSLQALSKLGELVDGHYRIVSQPPIVVPVREIAATYHMSADEVRK